MCTRRREPTAPTGATPRHGRDRRKTEANMEQSGQSSPSAQAGLHLDQGARAASDEDQHTHRRPQEGERCPDAKCERSGRQRLANESHSAPSRGNIGSFQPRVTGDSPPGRINTHCSHLLWHSRTLSCFAFWTPPAVLRVYALALRSGLSPGGTTGSAEENPSTPRAKQTVSVTPQIRS